MKIIFQAFFFALLILLTACSSRPVTYYHEKNPPTFFEAQGKAALRSPTKGVSVYFTWTRAGDDDLFVIRGPLGFGRAELHITPAATTLSSDNLDAPLLAETPDELLFRLTGAQAPVRALLASLLAAPPERFSARQYSPEGKLESLQVDEWRLDYKEWSEEAPNLPRKLHIAGPSGEATIIVGQWYFPPEAQSKILP